MKIEGRLVADGIDAEYIYLKCNRPKSICCERIHKYNSDGYFNGNRVLKVHSKCFGDCGEIIKINITKATKRMSLIDNKNELLFFSKLVFLEKLKNLEKDLEKSKK